MQKMLLQFALLCGLVVGGLGCGKSTLSPLKPGDEAPLTRLTMLDGSYRTLDELKGKTVVLLFWAQWCSKSNQLIDDLNKLSADLYTRDDVVFIAASVDKAEDLDKVKERIESGGLKYFAHAFSGNEGQDEAFVSFQCKDLPQVFVISPIGKILGSGETISVVKQALGITKP